MLADQLCLPTLSAFNPTFLDRSKATATCCSVSIQVQLYCSTAVKRCRNPQSLFLSSKSSRRSFAVRSSTHADHHDDDFLPASLLVTETVLHYRMRRQGFLENIKWQSSSSSSNQLGPFPFRAKNSGDDVTSIGQHFLSRFQSPTIFLKISCDGDFLLPIIVGEFAVEKIIDALLREDNGVNMVQITKRVVNTYFAKLYLSKPGKSDIISLDVRPSDAINVANRCKAPIYVSKEIVLEDTIRIGYGTGRGRDAKPTYDVYLDSASEGPDLVAEELNLVRNMDIAVKEERYSDAAMWRDKLTELRQSRH
ncbi:bifunctional nuclease 2-like isoform X2 [Mangifera indica]|uniref:bifunctional nuclease 2-like isoform X2 n=1 Tax=Mangifera indica TaxID=29780 RepID=UPI001CFBDD8F|nr:bifunctional nuclease 2-like isoform X2 [Mangifera indica]